MNVFLRSFKCPLCFVNKTSLKICTITLVNEGIAIDMPKLTTVNRLESQLSVDIPMLREHEGKLDTMSSEVDELRKENDELRKELESVNGRYKRKFDMLRSLWKTMKDAKVCVAYEKGTYLHAIGATREITLEELLRENRVSPFIRMWMRA